MNNPGEYLHLAASACLSRWINLGRTLAPDRIESVLIVKLDHLGDVLTALPALCALRQALPGARMSLLAGPWTRTLLHQHPAVDDIAVYHSPAYYRTAWSDEDTPDLDHIYRQRFDLMVGLREDAATLRAALRHPPHYRLDRGTYRIGLHIARRTGRLEPSLFEYDIQHEVATNLGIIRPLITGPLPPCGLPVSPEHYGRIAEGLAEIQAPDRRFILMHPGGSWPYSRWAPERFAELADLVWQTMQRPVLFYAGPGEDAILEHVRRAARLPHFMFPWPLEIPAWFELTRRAACVVCSDSAQVHLAGLAGTPVVGLFGPTAPERFGPWRQPSAVLHHPVDCFPCNRTLCKKPEQPCVNLNSVQDAVAALRRVLEKAGK